MFVFLILLVVVVIAIANWADTNPESFRAYFGINSNREDK